MMCAEEAGQQVAAVLLAFACRRLLLAVNTMELKAPVMIMCAVQNTLGLDAVCGVDTTAHSEEAWQQVAAVVFAWLLDVNC